MLCYMECFQMLQNGKPIDYYYLQAKKSFEISTTQFVFSKYVLAKKNLSKLVIFKRRQSIIKCL